MNPTPEMLTMARAICARIVEGDSDNPLRVMKANRYLTGDFDDDHHIAIALAAITAVTEGFDRVLREYGIDGSKEASVADHLRVLLSQQKHLKGATPNG